MTTQATTQATQVSAGRLRGRYGDACELLDRAERALVEARVADGPARRYCCAHVAALRTAAAVLAVRTRPGSRRGQRNAWELLASVAPELREWAAFFAAGAAKRAAAECGATTAVTARAADDLVRDVEHFMHIVEDVLGLARPLGWARDGRVPGAPDDPVRHG
jgi:hypothetical protein